MREFMAFISKETKHILRDSRTMMVLFGMPIVMMLLFGFAISTDVRNVRTVTVTPVEDMLTRRIAERLDASEYFTVTGSTDPPESAASMIRSGRADMAVVFQPSPASHRYDGEEAIQIMTDGSDPNMSVLHANYAGLIAAETLYGQTAADQAVETRLMYNPQMKSSYNFVPGIMGMLMLIICTMMTSVSIVREKERGSMDTLLVSPVRPVVIITAKAVPYFVLSTVILACIITISRFVLGVPIAGSLPVIALVSFIYIVLALSLGLLISTATHTQVAALLASGMMMLVPTLLLSGMIFPVESMPEILQYVSAVVPARWYISAVRKIMIMGAEPSTITVETCVLLAMTATLLAAALRNFKEHLK